MLDGLYSAKFVTPLGGGAGVVLKSGTQLRGGDSAFAWTGAAEYTGTALSGTLEVLKHDSGMSSVFGPLTNFTLNFSGTFGSDNAKLNATSPQAPGVTMTIHLTRLTD